MSSDAVTDAEHDPFVDRATPMGRVAWALLGASSWAVISTALWLRPDSRGYGTHQQLGLAPCAFTAATGVPCPGCGLTTSFANLAHGHVFTAFSAHLMGPLLFLIVLAIACYAPYAVTRARPLAVLLDSRASLPVLIVTASAGILTFALRLAHVMHSG